MEDNRKLKFKHFDLTIECLQQCINAVLKGYTKDKHIQIECTSSPRSPSLYARVHFYDAMVILRFSDHYNKTTSAYDSGRYCINKIVGHRTKCKCIMSLLKDGVKHAEQKYYRASFKRKFREIEGELNG